MHDQAMEWIAKHATAEPVTVLDIGGRNVNGSPRHLFPAAIRYMVLDVRPGDGVDIIADAATWDPAGRRWDLVICAEVLEHAASWRAICRTAYAACAPGGRLIVTTAAPGRPPHSAVDGEFRLLPGEHYANIRPAELERVLAEAGWAEIVVDVQPSPADVRAVAVKAPVKFLQPGGVQRTLRDGPRDRVRLVPPGRRPELVQDAVVRRHDRRAGGAGCHAYAAGAVRGDVACEQHRQPPRLGRFKVNVHLSTIGGGHAPARQGAARAARMGTGPGVAGPRPRRAPGRRGRQDDHPRGALVHARVHAAVRRRRQSGAAAAAGELAPFLRLAPPGESHVQFHVGGGGRAVIGRRERRPRLEDEPQRGFKVCRCRRRHSAEAHCPRLATHNSTGEPPDDRGTGVRAAGRAGRVAGDRPGRERRGGRAADRDRSVRGRRAGNVALALDGRELRVLGRTPQSTGPSLSAAIHVAATRFELATCGL